MIWALILVPAFASLAAFVLRGDRPRRAVWIATAVLHAAMTALSIASPASSRGWIGLDALARPFLGITSLLFLAATAYGIPYLAREPKATREDLEEELIFSNAPEARFTGSMLAFLATMTLVAASQHFGLLWVAVEATTLASAPLVYFHRHHRSLEATWKYLLICSVGIALALMGNFCLAASALSSGHVPLSIAALVDRAHALDGPWVKAAFLFMLVGYGTKMGLAPMHTWLPDAHSESPSVVSALLSGALLNCAFLGVLRSLEVCVAAGLGDFARSLLVGFGLLSMGIAAVFILEQADYKRMLAYSSIEHMGILALGVGIGGAATFGAMLHSVNHAVGKAMLFFCAGNILAAYGTKATSQVRGALDALPVTGALWLLGVLAITGSPPFGPFLSELAILRGALDQGRGVVAALYLLLLVLVFAGMVRAVIGMAQGPSSAKATSRELPSSFAPPLGLGALLLVLGVYVPPALQGVLSQAARVLAP